MQNIVRWCSDQFQPNHIWNPWSNRTDANLEDLHSTSAVILPIESGRQTSCFRWIWKETGKIFTSHLFKSLSFLRCLQKLLSNLKTEKKIVPNFGGRLSIRTLVSKNLDFQVLCIIFNKIWLHISNLEMLTTLHLYTFMTFSLKKYNL